MAHTHPTSASASPNPYFIVLKEFVDRPAVDFKLPNNDFFPSYVWRADLPQSEMKALVKLSGTRLQDAIAAQIKAMLQEIDKLKVKAEQCRHVIRYEEPEDMKGDICARVLGRWEHERIVAEMTGRDIMGRPVEFEGSGMRGT